MHAISSEKPVEERTRHVLSEIFAGCPAENVGVRLWDGTMWPDDRPRKAVLALNHPGALGRMFLPGTEVGLAEAMKRRIVCGVFTFPARHTDFGVVILPFTKHCSQSWTH